MKPHVICHMMASVDGRILGRRWRPRLDSAGVFEAVHDRIGCDAWMVGRVTGQEFAKGSAPYPVKTDASFRRAPWFATRAAPAWGVVLDAQGKIAWGRADIGGDPIVVVLTEQVSDSHLAGLRDDGVSYVFAGKVEVDLPEALEVLNRELGVERLLMEGGGGANGALLHAGLIDELSLVIAPAVDGAPGAPAVFEGPEGAGAPPIERMALTHCEMLEGGCVWLRLRADQ